MVVMLERPVGIYAKKNAVIISLNETIGYTFQFMIKYNIRHISIIDDDLSLVGILSAYDILRELIKSPSAKFLSIKNSEVMKKDIFFVDASDTIRNTILTMNRLNFSALPVLVGKSFDGMFTENDIISLDHIWDEIPDATFTPAKGIGHLINQNDIIPQDFTLLDAANKILDTGRNFILIKNKENQFSGIVSINKILGAIIPLLMFAKGNTAIFKSVKIDTLVRESVIERKSPGLLMITKNLMRSRGIEAVVLFEDGKPMKLVTQTDIVNHLANYI
jgi:CBS domain-containing protein